MNDLIARLEAAAGGNRLLDAEIGFAVGHYTLHLRSVWSNIEEPSRMMFCWSEDGQDVITALAQCLSLPHYTTSLDAALSALPKGDEYEITNLYGVARASVSLNNAEYGPSYGTREDGNLPIAVCIAVVKARSPNRSNEGRKGLSKIYVASSWRNPIQPDIVNVLRFAGHEVYDFRNPAPGNSGFAWSQIDPDWLGWEPGKFAQLLTTHPVAAQGFAFDKGALDWCDTCVMVLPCGRSAHLEAGYACGQGKRVIFYLHPDKFEPELMYLLGTALVTNPEDLLLAVDGGETPYQTERQQPQTVAA